MDLKLAFTDDIYNNSICAILTKPCPPLVLNSVIKSCFFCFGMQALLSIFYFYSIDKSTLKFVPIITM